MSLSQSERSDVAIAPPEPDLTPDEIVRRARDMAPRLLELQAETEERSYYSEETHKAFDEAGFYRILLPRRYGGYEFDVTTFTQVVIELMRACPSTGWQFCLGANHVHQIASYFPQQAQDELLSHGHCICPSTGMPTGVLEKVDDGWTLKGTFSYCSGAPYATHFLGTAMTVPSPGADDGTKPTLSTFVVDRAQWKRLDDWGGQLGLRGSGSHSLEVDARIPDHWVLENMTLRSLKPKGETPGLKLHGNPLYRGSWFGMMTLQCTAQCVGMALAAQDEYERLMKTKRTPLPPPRPRFQDPAYQRWYAAAAAKVATANAVRLGIIRQYEEQCERDTFTMEDDMLYWLTGREVLELCWTAVQGTFFRTSGSSEVRPDTRIGRYYRDLSQLWSHAGFNTLTGAVSLQLTRLRFGLADGSDWQWTDPQHDPSHAP